MGSNKVLYISIRDISRLMGVNYRTAFAYCHQCRKCKQFRLKCKCIDGIETLLQPTNVGNSNEDHGKTWRVSREQVDEFLKERKY